MSLKRVCLVTDELYPFSAGGIGRLLHNVIRDSHLRGAPVEFHVLVPAYTGWDTAAVEAYFGHGTKVHVAEQRPEWDQSYDEDGVYPPAGAFTDSRWHAESMDLLLHLKRLAREGLRFDVIEFPDYRGWAFCTLQEKYLGRALEGTEVSVRLHSTAGIISRYEPHVPDKLHLGRFELERKALLDAERVVAHIPGIAEVNQRFYGFPESWLRKVTLEFPPVAEGTPAAPPEVEERDLLFLTKMQWVKRPDLFVRGAALFMSRNPEYQGRAVLACHAAFPEYQAALQRMVPQALRERFVFSGPSSDREALMARGIVVIPSDHEALNLTAYEASAAGATLVLNVACPAFVPGTPFKDGENCYLFDGTVEGLADTLARAWKGPKPRPVAWKAEVPYWEQAAAREAPSVGAPRTRLPRVSVIITNHTLGRYLPETLASVAASSYTETEVILVDDASTDPFDHELLARIEQQSHEGRPVKLVRNPVNRGLPASRNIGIQAATGDYVLPLDADDCISPSFLELAVQALERHRDFDVVVPSTGYFQSDEALEARQFCDYALFIGDVPSLGLVANRLSCATSLMRRDLFNRFRYNDRLSSYEDWELYLRLAQAGCRFLVTNQLHFHYRRRAQSMITGVNPRRHLELLSQMYVGLPMPLSPAAQLGTFISLAGTPPSESAARPVEPQVAPQAEPPPAPRLPRPLRYEVADRMNEALKNLPLVHPLLKRVTHDVGGTLLAQTVSVGDTAMGDVTPPLRYRLVDTMNQALKRLPGVHPAIKWTAQEAAARRGRSGAR
jgi:glycosyltransferase involved in cell wall biosynthesis